MSECAAALVELAGGAITAFRRLGRVPPPDRNACCRARVRPFLSRFGCWARIWAGPAIGNSFLDLVPNTQMKYFQFLKQKMKYLHFVSLFMTWNPRARS
jgi:hypothetical protein